MPNKARKKQTPNTQNGKAEEGMGNQWRAKGNAFLHVALRDVIAAVDRRTMESPFGMNGP